MRFINPIPFVQDIAVSKHFYGELLGLSVAEDHGNFVRFETGFAIHEGTSLARTIWGNADDLEMPFGRQNLLLYFEENDIDATFERISAHVRLIHPIEMQAWGQRVFRFYDPDGHVVEIGEPQSSNELA
ncbi:MAG: VOC family protein [Pseudomonadota bacterium]